MKRALLGVICLLAVLPAGAQMLTGDLARFVETPAVSGYEEALAREIRARLERFKPETDNMGNVYVTLGSPEASGPHRLIVAPMDEPGYVVSAITADGYLRVQRLPQQAPHPMFDQLHAAQVVVIYTRKGKRVYGVVAGLSTHLQTARRDAPRVSHPDEIFIDIGASSAAEVRRAGVDVLDPLALDRRFYALGYGKLTGVGIGDRFGAAALVELLRGVDASKIKGTLTVAFVAQQWANARGLERMLQRTKPEEVVYVGRLLPQRVTPASREPVRSPRREPGSGVLIGMANPDAAAKGLSGELKKLAEGVSIAVAADYSAPFPRGVAELGEKIAHLSIATAWPVTPAEVIDGSDLSKLVNLLYAYVAPDDHATWADKKDSLGERAASLEDRRWGPSGPPVTYILKRLVEVYGVSNQEGPVREEIKRLLPRWAKPETDAAGNLVLRFGSTPAGKKKPRIVVVAHTDEIGYVVRSVAEDGRLMVQSRGGGIPEFFAGHAVLVHTASGARPGVMELPTGWDQPGFEWPRGAGVTTTAEEGGQPSPARTWRVDVGARSAAEVEQLGIKVGDSGDTLTVPKEYRPLFGTRANGRSFDDRVGCTSLIAAAWMLGPSIVGREIIFIWSTREEIGLRGAQAAAQQMASEGRGPDYVFAVDTFVSSDSPIESKRFANAEIGKGFVIRAVDNSNIARRELVDRVVALARAQKIPVQYGVTGGGNDGSAFLRYGAQDIPIAWPLRYSHSPGEVIDTRDVDALAKIVAAISRGW